MWCAYMMHVQGMTKHIRVKVCKTHTQWSKHDKQVQSWNPQSLELIGIQNKHQNAIWAFYQTLGMHL